MNKIAIVRGLAGVVVGSAAGYTYHRAVGCSTGACPIVASPKLSTLYGAVMGLLIALT